MGRGEGQRALSALACSPDCMRAIAACRCVMPPVLVMSMSLLVPANGVFGVDGAVSERRLFSTLFRTFGCFSCGQQKGGGGSPRNESGANNRATEC